MKGQYDTCDVSLNIAFPKVWELEPGGGTVIFLYRDVLLVQIVVGACSRCGSRNSWIFFTFVKSIFWLKEFHVMIPYTCGDTV